MLTLMSFTRAKGARQKLVLLMEGHNRWLDIFDLVVLVNCCIL